MRIHSRPGLAREGQGPRPMRKEVIGPVGAVTPLATRRIRAEDYWAKTNDRLRDMGDFAICIDRRILLHLRGPGRGRPYHPSVIEAGLMLAAMFHLPLRQTEGLLRAVFAILGLDRDLAPDYSTLARRRGDVHPAHAPALPMGQPVVLLIDATGARLDSARGWNQDKPGGDRRRGQYLKVHLAVDAQTGLIIDYDITPSTGRGTGDASVAPSLIARSFAIAQSNATHLAAGIGDGAYDSVEIYKAMRRYGGIWYAPLPTRPQRGRHDDRDRHIDGEARLGELYSDRLGYHQRSLVEATNSALKSTVGLSSRARSFPVQANEIAWQITVYNRMLQTTL